MLGVGHAVGPTVAYAPHQKGNVERVNRTIGQESPSGLPFHTDGARAADGRLYGPDVAPMVLGMFGDHFAERARECLRPFGTRPVRRAHAQQRT